MTSDCRNADRDITYRQRVGHLETPIDYCRDPNSNRRRQCELEARSPGESIQENFSFFVPSLNGVSLCQRGRGIVPSNSPADHRDKDIPMPKKTWIEVALNGAWTRRIQPRIPVTADEIVSEGVACVKAGAAIVHAHTLDPESGRQNNDVENCAAFMSGIRSQVDAVVYPTAVPPPNRTDWKERYATIVELRRRGLAEWGFIDPGSVNLWRADGPSPSYNDDRAIYGNSPGFVEYQMQQAEEHQFHPAYACYEPGFVRHGAMLHRRHPRTPTPIYRFMFTSSFTFSFPPERWALEAYVNLLESVAPSAPWIVAGLGVDVLPLIPTMVAMGGHLRVGLEDAPHNSPGSNLELVDAAVDAIQKAGGEPATAVEVRAALKPRLAEASKFAS
jgi:3-keto-5-aminohexanoate cleavage enzyme